MNYCLWDDTKFSHKKCIFCTNQGVLQKAPMCIQNITVQTKTLISLRRWIHVCRFFSSLNQVVDYI